MNTQKAICGMVLLWMVAMWAFPFPEEDAPASQATTWDWDFGDGTAHSTLQNPTHTYTAPGTYVVTMTVVKDGQTCSKTGSVTVTATCPDSSATGLPSGPTVVQGGGYTSSGTISAGSNLTKVTLALSPPSGPADNSVTTNPGAKTFPLASLPIPAAKLTQLGVYTVGVWVKSANCPNSELIGQFSLTVIADCPDASVTGLPASPTVALGQGFTSTGTIIAGSGLSKVTLSLNRPDGGTDSSVTASPQTSTYDLSSLPIPAAKLTQVGTYTVGIWVKTQSCPNAESIGSFSLRVYDPCQTPQISRQPADVQIQSGSSATLLVEATGTSPLSYAWFQGSSGDTSNPAPGSTNGKTYTTPFLSSTAGYWCRVANACGNAKSRMATVTVNPAACAIDCQGGPTTPLPYAPGQAVVFHASYTKSPSCTETPSIQWTFGDGASATGEEAAHAYDAPGTYAWKVVVANGQTSCSQEGKVSVFRSGALVSGRLLIADPARPGKTWPLDRLVESGNDVSLHMVNEATGRRVDFRLSPAGEFNSQDLLSGSEEDLLGGSLNCGCLVEYWDNVDNNNSSGLGEGCPPPAGNGRSRRVSLRSPVAALEQGRTNQVDIAFPPPVVILHGIRDCWEAWDEWARTLNENGFFAFTPNHPFIGVQWEDEADVLHRQIRKDMDALTSQRIPLSFVCHSEGGVAARVYLNIYGTWWANNHDVFTMGTPHSGTSFLGAFKYCLAVKDMSEGLNPMYPRFPGGAHVFAISGHGHLVWGDGLLFRDDGIVYLEPDPLNPFGNFSPFNICSASGSEKTVRQNFPGEVIPWNGKANEHNVGLSHTSFWNKGLGLVLQNIILPRLKGEVPLHKAEPWRGASWETHRLESSGTPAVPFQKLEAEADCSLPSRKSTDFGFTLGAVEEATIDILGDTSSFGESLLSPSGVLYSAESLPPRATHWRDAMGGHFHLTAPEPGSWRLRLQNYRASETAAYFSVRSKNVWRLAGNSTVSGAEGGGKRVQLEAEVTGSPDHVLVTGVFCDIRDGEGKLLQTVPLASGARPNAYSAEIPFSAASGKYDAWFRMNGTEGGQPVTAAAHSSFAAAPDTAEFTGGFQESPVDQDGDGVSDHLAVAVGLQVSEAGTYGVFGQLYDAGDYPVAYAHTTLTVEAGGAQTAVLSFPLGGFSCDCFGGAFTLRGLALTGSGRSTWSRFWEGAYRTAAYSGSSFGCSAAEPPPLPVIQGVFPGAASPGERGRAVIGGEGFSPEAQVSMGGGVSVLSQRFLDHAALEVDFAVDASAALGERTVRIVNPDGRAGEKAGGFSIVPPRGDVNGDGLVDAADYAALRECLCGASVLAPYGDLDADGAVTSADLLFLTMILAGQ